MTAKLEIDDFVELAFALKHALTAHEVPDKLHYSLISDNVFSFASFLDEKIGTSFHEQIYSLLDEHAEQLSGTLAGDYLIAELEILFEKGRKREMNLLKSHVDNSEHLLFDLEMTLEIRDLDEIDEVIDVNARFIKLLKKRKGIKAIKFNSAENLEKADWLEVPLAESEFGNFEQSLDGIEMCIREVTKKWL